MCRESGYIKWPPAPLPNHNADEGRAGLVLNYHFCTQRGCTAKVNNSQVQRRKRVWHFGEHIPGVCGHIFVATPIFLIPSGKQKLLEQVNLLSIMSKDLLDKLDLELAIKYIITDSNTDFIIDKLGIELLKNYSQNFIDHLANKIIECDPVLIKTQSAKEYEPLPLQIIDVPKRDLSLRPGTVPEIIDRIYYQALCNAIAPKIDKKLDFNNEKVVFSYRLSDENDNESSYMFVKPSTAYNEFISYQSSLCESGEYSYIVETDVANYFERIYHHKLWNLLEGLNCDEEIVAALAQLLRKWNEGISYGIPQGLWPSDLLGNIYLHDLDVTMKSERVQFIRNVDDIRVFCKTETDAKLALIKINQTLRSLGLNIQPSKTFIHKIDDFYHGIHIFLDRMERLKLANKNIIINFDPYFNEFKMIEGEITEETFELIGLDELFDSAIQEPLKEQEIKFCLGAYAHFQKPAAISFCLDNFGNLPHLSSYFINYLTSLDYNSNVASHILEFLKSELNLYSWQEMWLIRYFHLTHEFDINLVTYLRNIFMDGNKPVVTRSIAALILGAIGMNAELNLLKNNFNKTDSLWIKRSIMFGIARLPESDRNHVYSYWKKKNWCFGITSDYSKKI